MVASKVIKGKLYIVWCWETLHSRKNGFIQYENTKKKTRKTQKKTESIKYEIMIKKQILIVCLFVVVMSLARANCLRSSPVALK